MVCNISVSEGHCRRDEADSGSIQIGNCAPRRWGGMPAYDGAELVVGEFDPGVYAPVGVRLGVIVGLNRGPGLSAVAGGKSLLRTARTPSERLVAKVDARQTLFLARPLPGRAAVVGPLHTVFGHHPAQPRAQEECAAAVVLQRRQDPRLAFVDGSYGDRLRFALGSLGA